MQQLFIMQLGYKILAIVFLVHDERTDESGKKRCRNVNQLKFKKRFLPESLSLEIPPRPVHG